jgi:general secretion pathway protein M
MKLALDLGRLEPWWRRGQGWWSERSLREQVLVGAFAALAIFALLIVAIIRPLQSARAAALSDIRSADMLAARVTAAGPAIATQARMRSGTSSAIVTDSVAAAGLSVQRIEPEGGRLRVVLGDASFDTVLRWVADVEASSNLRVGEARIERRPAPGIVSAQFLLAG